MLTRVPSGENSGVVALRNSFRMCTVDVGDEDLSVAIVCDLLCAALTRAEKATLRKIVTMKCFRHWGRSRLESARF